MTDACPHADNVILSFLIMVCKNCKYLAMSSHQAILNVWSWSSGEKKLATVIVPDKWKGNNGFALVTISDSYPCSRWRKECRYVLAYSCSLNGKASFRTRRQANEHAFSEEEPAYRTV